MKATLTFSIPEEQTEHMQAVQAGKVIGVLADFHSAIRSLDKWESTQELSPALIKAITEASESKIDVAIETRNMLLKMLAAAGIDIFS